MDKKLSKAFSSLRFLLALLVVYIHIDSNCPLSFNDISQIGGGYLTSICHYCNIVISQTLARLAVPTFFFMSGYLFFANVDNFSWATWRKKMQPRIRSLLIPYVLWNVIAYVFFVYVKHEAVSTNGIWAKVDYAFLRPADFPLWYVRDLMVMVCFAPVVYWLCRKLHGACIISLTVLYLLFADVSLGFLSVSSIYFFVFGSYVCTSGVHFTMFAPWARTAIYTAAGILGIAMVVTYGNREEHLWNFFLLIGVIAVLLLSYNANIKIYKHLVASSFFVYASHRLGITAVAKSLFGWIPDEGYSHLTSYLVAPIMTYLICTLLFVALKKYAPKVSGLLNGR